MIIANKKRFRAETACQPFIIKYILLVYYLYIYIAIITAINLT